MVKLVLKPHAATYAVAQAAQLECFELASKAVSHGVEHTGFRHQWLYCAVGSAFEIASTCI